MERFEMALAESQELDRRLRISKTETKIQKSKFKAAVYTVMFCFLVMCGLMLWGLREEKE